MLRNALALVLMGGLVFGAAAADHFDRGRELYSQKKFEEANRLFEDAVKEEPENAAAHYHLGLTQLELKRWSDAQRHLERAHELKADSADHLIALGRAHAAQKNYEKARASFASAEKLIEESNRQSAAELAYQRGMMAMLENDKAAAVEHYEKALELDPKNSYAHYYLGMAYSDLGRKDKMINHFQTFAQMNPDAPEAKRVQSMLKSGRR
jgi:tetratricopeptide (TPR) repeat protein